MNNLLELTNAADRAAVIQANLERLDESQAFSRTPTRVNGELNTISGPPTMGTWSQYQLWVDQDCVLWLCTAAGTPGTWKRIEPSLVEQNVCFSSEALVVEGGYVGGRFRWSKSVSLKSASVVCVAPVGDGISFTLEVAGVLTALVLTVAAGETGAELDLGGLVVDPGVYVRWICTSAPEAGVSKVYISTLLTV